MKVVFYIGHHKVGSTALQVFLSQNWLRLARAGILYPAVESRGFSNNLAKALNRRERAAELPVNIREPHSALAYRMMADVSPRKVPAQFQRLPGTGQMLEALRTQVQWLKPKAVVFCSEAFSNFGQVEPRLIRRLRAQFPRAEIEIYCALRRIDEYLVSWHGQRLKAGERLASLGDGGTAAYFDNIHFDFRTVVEPWIEQIPDARLILRNYGDILAAGGSAEDFMAQTGLDFPEGMLPSGKANRSLPRAAMEIVRRANHDLPSDRAHALRKYLLGLDGGPGATPNRDVEMFGAKVRAELAARFAPIHDWLSDIAGTPAFFPDIGEVEKTRPVSEAGAMADLLSKIDPETLPGEDLRDYVAALRDKTPA